MNSSAAQLTADPQTPKSELQYIVVEGPIGVGKTSLVKRLAKSFSLGDSDVILEQPSDNPFLESFYDDPRSAALPTQLFFLFQRAAQLNALKQSDLFAPVTVSDFILEKDRLFAELNLAPAEFELYQQVYEKVRPEAPTPDLVVYLQAPVNVLQQRIRKRGVAFEQQMSKDYLQRLSEVYMHFFHDYNASPLLIVNAENIDFVGNDLDYAQLLEQIKAHRGGRTYFNPQSVLF